MNIEITTPPFATAGEVSSQEITPKEMSNYMNLKKIMESYNKGEPVQQEQSIPEQEETVDYSTGTNTNMKFSFPTSEDINPKAAADQAIRALNPVSKLAMGGSTDSQGDDMLNLFAKGGTHEQNPYGGIPQGTGQNGQMNTVEEGETSFKIEGKKFIFSNRIMI